MLAGNIREMPAGEENGNLYRYLVRQEDAETLEVACVTLAPGAETSPASHPDEEEVYLFLEGEGRLHIGGEEREVAAGDFAYVPRDAEHFIANTGEGPLSYMYVANFPDRPGKGGA